MVSRLLKVLAADVIIVFAELMVIGDLQARGAYAASPHGSANVGYSPSLSYSVLTHVFTMSGGPIPLVSPTTLDWSQVLILAFVLTNLWYVYPTLRRMRAPSPNSLT